ncbi:MAG: hypothetical protein DCC49_05845 [Acidobacteria bacterium]|nr:MAG: hypothetical protein DCC49_05845 [Acidobacteriota bacterium]
MVSEESLDPDEVQGLLDRWRAAYLAGDSVAVGDLYALDGLLAFAEEASSYAGRDAVEVAIESRFAEASSVGEVVFEWGEPIIDGEMVAVEFCDLPDRGEANGVAIMRIVRGRIVFDRRFREPPNSGGQ